MQKHFSPLELQKIIKKNKRRSKKDLFVLLEKDINVVSVFYKEPKQERKIFIAFDVVLNLDLFNQSSEYNEDLFFNDVNSWRTPIKITKQFIPGAQIPTSMIVNNLYQQIQTNLHQQESTTNDLLFNPSNQNSDTTISLYFKESPINNNFLIQIELDTQTPGMNNFVDFAKVLKSFSHEKAHNLANQLIKYQEFVQLCLDTYIKCEKNMMKILPNFTEENILEQMIQDQNTRSFVMAEKIIQEKIKQNKFISYIIKINKCGQQLLHKFGYSRAFLDLMGINGNYEKFFLRRGPINPINPKNRLDRLIKGLSVKSNGFFKNQNDNYIDTYYDEDIYTIDNIIFTCDFKNEKYFLNQSDQYYVKAGFLLQIQSFDISEQTINRIMGIRANNNPVSLASNIQKDINISDLQYTCESEIFLSKYYA